MSDLQTTRARALALFEGTQRLTALARRHDLMREIDRYVPTFQVALHDALAHAAHIQRNLMDSDYDDERDALAELATAVARLEGQARLIRAAAVFADATIALRDRQLLAAAQRTTASDSFKDLVLERLHQLRLNEMRRQTEAAKADAVRTEAVAELEELKRALRETAAPPPAAATETIEDKIAVGSATAEELEQYKARRA